MDTVEIRLIYLVVNFWNKAVTNATSHLMTGKHIPHFGLNSLVSTLSSHTLSHHGNDFEF